MTNKLTPKDIEKIYKENYTRLSLTQKQMIDLENKGENLYSEFSKYDIRFLKRIYEETTNLFNAYDLDETIKELQEFKKFSEENKDKIWYSENYNTEYWNEERGDDPSFTFNYKYYIVSKEEKDIEFYAKVDTKNKVCEILFEYAKENATETAPKFLQTIDCKILQLFKDWTIDWETMANLTYTNCKL